MILIISRIPLAWGANSISHKEAWMLKVIKIWVSRWLRLWRAVTRKWTATSWRVSPREGLVSTTKLRILLLSALISTQKTRLPILSEGRPTCCRRSPRELYRIWSSSLNLYRLSWKRKKAPKATAISWNIRIISASNCLETRIRRLNTTNYRRRSIIRL